MKDWYIEGKAEDEGEKTRRGVGVREEVGVGMTNLKVNAKVSKYCQTLVNSHNAQGVCGAWLGLE